MSISFFFLNNILNFVSILSNLIIYFILFLFNIVLLFYCPELLSKLSTFIKTNILVLSIESFNLLLNHSQYNIKMFLLHSSQ